MGLRLQRFCCCCTLRTGTLVIGTAGWIFTLLELFLLVDSDDESTGDKELDRSIQVWQLDGLSSSSLCYQIGYGIVSLIVAVLLVVGVYKKDNRFILPWLVLKCFEGAITILVTILIFILGCINAHLRGILFVCTLILIFISVLVWYAWLCVYSHYRDLGERVPQNRIPPVHYTPTSAPPPAYNESDKTKCGMA